MAKRQTAPGPEHSTPGRDLLRLLNPTVAVERLRERSFTQREQFDALMFFTAILYFGIGFRLVAWPEPFSAVSLVRFLVDPIGLGATIWFAHRQNRRNEDVDFLVRFLFVSIPVIVRIALVFWLLIFAWSFTEAIRVQEPLPDTSWDEVMLVAFMYGVICWRTAFYMGKIDQISR
jgi:hypothetical protein